MSKSKEMNNDVPEDVKSARLQEIIDLQKQLSEESKQRYIGQTVEVLAESVSKKSQEKLSGRTSQNMVTVFPAKRYAPRDYVRVRITGCTPATLLGEAES
ncbi:MAG: TRAM domain-containing protein [Bacteroidales bacterium]|nr:TRAM domain-containing protein [Bacteroidales bacterium]